MIVGYEVYAVINGKLENFEIVAAADMERRTRELRAWAKRQSPKARVVVRAIEDGR
jgi:hypothetical protein